MMKPILIFRSDESPGRTRSAHVACAQLLSRLAGHSVCGLGIHPIKISKWVSSLGLKNLVFQRFAVISMNVQFFLATPRQGHWNRHVWHLILPIVNLFCLHSISIWNTMAFKILTRLDYSSCIGSNTKVITHLVHEAQNKHDIWMREMLLLLSFPLFTVLKVSTYDYFYWSSKCWERV